MFDGLPPIFSLESLIKRSKKAITKYNIPHMKPALLRLRRLGGQRNVHQIYPKIYIIY